MMLRLTSIAVLLAVCVCAGCRKAAEEAMESAIESQMARDGGKSDVEIGDKGVSFTMQDEKGESTFARGENVKLPAGFPKDVPLYAKMTLVIASTQAQDEMFIIQATSADTMDQIAAFYKQEAPKQGWEEESSMDQGSEMKALAYKKEGRSLNVILGVTDDGTTVSINTGKSD